MEFILCLAAVVGTPGSTVLDRTDKKVSETFPAAGKVPDTFE